MAALVCAAVIGCYAWIVHPAVSQLGNSEAREAYYNLLVDGFRSGHLSLSRQPAPELANLADPSDPVQNRPYRLHDASYFRGKFYLYFGVTPALVLFWPFLTVTGNYLWHSQAVAVFCAGGFLATALVLLGARRRYFPAAGAWLTGALLLAVGMATTAPVLLRRPDVWEVPIACAYALAMLALAAIWRSLHSDRRAAAWLALASLAYGLAVGARPVVLFGGAMLLVPLLRICRREGSRAWRNGRAWRLLAAAVLPMAAIGAGLALYNYARFGSVLEFGQNHQMAEDNQGKLQHFSAGFLWFNFRVYFLEPMRLSSYFPFVLGIKIPPPPPGQFGTENPFGVLTNLPVTWLALAAPLAWRRRPAAEGDPLRWFTAAVALLFVLSAFTVCLFGGACHRYEMDFAPALTLLAALGILGLERAAAGWAGSWRWLTRAVWAGLLAWSVACNFFASCQFGGLLHRDDPAAFNRLARVFDYPAYAVEKLRGLRPGPVEIRFRLPPYAGSLNEPILVAGAAPDIDYFFFNYRDASHLVIGLEHTGHGGPLSEPIPVDYSREHTLVIDAGPVYPPPAHPFFAGQDEFAVVARSSALRLILDGEVVMDRMFPFYAASPQTRFIGRSPMGSALGTRFTGTILSVRTLPIAPLRSVRSGPLGMKLRFPLAGLGGQAQPLVVTGETGRGDLLYVRAQPDGRLVFGLDHWGVRVMEGEPQTIDLQDRHDVAVRMGSFYPAGPASEQNPETRQLNVTVDGREVLKGQVDFYRMPTPRVFVGYNPIGGSSTAESFAGSIIQVTASSEQ